VAATRVAATRVVAAVETTKRLPYAAAAIRSKKQSPGTGPGSIISCCPLRLSDLRI
jgi:hypothetical protein